MFVFRLESQNACEIYMQAATNKVCHMIGADRISYRIVLANSGKFYLALNIPNYGFDQDYWFFRF